MGNKRLTCVGSHTQKSSRIPGSQKWNGAPTGIDAPMFRLVSLEVKAGLQHDQAERVESRCCGNASETSIVDVHLWIGEGRGIGDVFSRRAELRAEAFVDPDSLDHVHIQGLRAGAVDGFLG